MHVAVRLLRERREDRRDFNPKTEITIMTPASKISRLVNTTDRLDFSSATVIHEERSVQGVWSKPNVPVLIFADHMLPGPSVTFHDGAIGTGLPVQLIFWGSWWNSQDGAQRASLIIDRTRAVINSEYFSELEQYGIARPTWRGSITVSEPGPPSAFKSIDDEAAVWDLIDDLIDDDVFPDPDDGRIAFVVLMPQGFTETIGNDGAHYFDDDYDFPFDEDKSWVAWVRYFDRAKGEDPEDTIEIVTHELVEMFTDPELEGWYTQTPQTGEISDAGRSAGNLIQTAWVNGARVASYWSNRHSATVIPIDRDYAAQLKGVTSEEGRKVIRSGTFRPEPSDSAACETIPQCCMKDREYSWTLHGFDEVARIRLATTRYREPKTAWKIEGFPVTGAGNVSFTLLTEVFSGRKAEARRQLVKVTYKATDDLLEIHVAGSECNFDLNVSCSVTDASIQGNVRTNVIAVPSVVVGFVGVQIALDPEYTRQRTACFAAMVAQYNKNFKRLDEVPGPGDPVNQDMIAQLPAYARIEQYRMAREALMLSRMAKALLPAKDARDYAMSLVDAIPAVARAVQADQETYDSPPPTLSSDYPESSG
jgi:hypothetical protein